MWASQYSFCRYKGVIIILVNPTLACANPISLKEDLDQLLEAKVQLLHIDIMDGHYVPNLSMNLDQIRAIGSYTQLPLDVHLMVTNPLDYLDRLAALGVRYVSFHLDSTSFPLRVIRQIQALGMQAGLALNPAQPVSVLEPLLEAVDYLLVMGVDPGFSGQSFLPVTYSKLAALNQLRKENGYHYLLMVDGGVDFEIGKQCRALGADSIVCGMFICFGQQQSIKDCCLRFAAHLDSFLPST